MRPRAIAVDMVYGRFGASGQCIRYAMENKDEAWKLMRRSMRGAIKPLAEP